MDENIEVIKTKQFIKEITYFFIELLTIECNKNKIDFNVMSILIPTQMLAISIVGICSDNIIEQEQLITGMTESLRVTLDSFTIYKAENENIKGDET